MNCASAEKLLPLYARVDLDRSSHSAVAEHLESCANCRQLADEYKNLQSWIRLHEPPEFSEEFFAGIRQNVLREIGQRPVASSTFSNWLRTLFAPAFSQTRFAVATAALVVICGAIGFYAFYESKNTAGLSAKVETVKSEPNKEALPINRVTSSIEDKSQSRQETKHDSRSLAKSFNRVRRGTAGIKPTVVRNPTPDTSSVEATSVASVRTSDPVVSSSQGPLRVEMQTQNPDIRIIWFAHNTKQASSTN